MGTLVHTEPVADLPPSIQRAIARVSTVASEIVLAALDLRDRWVLIQLIRNVSLDDPYTPVTIRKSTLARQLGCSEATVYRSLAKLERAGWFARSQVKSRRTGFQVGCCVFSAEAIKWLGLAEPAQHRTARRSSVRDACCISVELRSQLSTKGQPAAAEALGKKGKAAIAADKVPSDVRWLVEAKRVSPFGVFALMREATKHGHRLSNVVAACRSAVEQATNAYAFVKRLVSQPRDFAYLAAEQRYRVEHAERQARQEREDTQLAASLQGSWWHDAKRGRILKVRGEFVEIAEPREAVRPLGALLAVVPIRDILQPVRNGEFKAINPATVASELVSGSAPRAGDEWVRQRALHALRELVLAKPTARRNAS